MSEPSMIPSGIVEPKSHRDWVVLIAITVSAALVVFTYNQYLREDDDRTTTDASQQAVVSPVPTAEAYPSPTEPVPSVVSDQDTAWDLCWGSTLPGTQTTVPRGMSVYDGLGIDAGTRVCMTPGEYVLYQEAGAKWLAAEQVVRDYVTQNTYETAPMLLQATAAIAYLCTLDGASINQQVAARVVFNELASEGVDFDETLDAMCGDRFHPTPSAPRVYSPAPEPTSWPVSPEPEPGR